MNNDANRVRMEDMFWEADRLISEQKIGEAFTKLNSILNEMPDFGKAHNHLGWIYETKYKDYPNAEKHYKMSIEYAPEYMAGYYNYAIVLSTLKKWDELEVLLGKAMKVLGINMATIYNEYAIMYEMQGKYQEAIDAYMKNATNTLDGKQIDTARESIDRCKKKMDLINGTNTATTTNYDNGGRGR